jgi:hypothetical protein
VPEHGRGGIFGLVVAAVEPITVAKRWASILGVDVEGVHGEGVDPDREPGPGLAAARLTLDDGRQTVWFITSPSSEAEGIAEVDVALEGPPPRRAKPVEIGGVRFVLSSPQEESA